MPRDPLSVLFDRYRREGDLAALARVYEVAAPELLRLARHLHVRGQAREDLVQSTFLVAIERRESFDSARPLRPWLMGILLNKAFVDAPRTGALDPEALLGGEAPDQVAEAREFARHLVTALERLPPIYGEVLRAHYYGSLPPRAIAERLGRPHGTVRAQLHRGLRLLRGLLPAGLTLWLAWLGPARAALVRGRERVLRAAERAQPQARAAPRISPLPLAGRLAGALLVTLAGGLALHASLGSERGLVVEPARVADDTAPQPSSALSVAAAGARAAAHAPGAAGDAQTPEPEPYGALLVRVRFADGAPAADVGVRVYVWQEPVWADCEIRAATDERGELLLERVHAGPVGIYSSRGGDNGFGAEVTAGQRTEREIELPAGVELAGEVVDVRGAPVPGAEVWLSWSPLAAVGRTAARSDADGRFALRAVSPRRFLGARAPGFAPSAIEWLGSGGLREGTSAELRLVLPDGGGSVAGSVVDADGFPVAGARVELRERGSLGLGDAHVRDDGILARSPLPSVLVTDARGRFEAFDLPFADFALAISAAPPWNGVARPCVASPHVELAVQLPRSASVHGTVRFDDGELVSGANVMVLGHGPFGTDFVMAADELGRFRAEPLVPGVVELWVSHGHTGVDGPFVRETLQVAPGSVTQWDAVIARPRTLAGVLTDERGAPLAGWWVGAVRERPPGAEETLRFEAWLVESANIELERVLNQVATDVTGRFAIEGCAAQPVRLEVWRPEDRRRWPVGRFESIRPTQEPAILRVAASVRNASGLTGSIAGSQGERLACGEVFVLARTGGAAHALLGPDGAFALSSLPEGVFDLVVWARGHAPEVLATPQLAPGEVRELGLLRLGTGVGDGRAVLVRH